MPQSHPESPTSVAGVGRRCRPPRSESKDHEYAGLALGVPGNSRAAGGRPGGPGHPGALWPLGAANRPAWWGAASLAVADSPDGGLGRTDATGAGAGVIAMGRPRLLVPGDHRGNGRGSLGRDPDLDRRRPESVA